MCFLTLRDSLKCTPGCESCGVVVNTFTLCVKDLWFETRRKHKNCSKGSHAWKNVPNKLMREQLKKLKHNMGMDEAKHTQGDLEVKKEIQLSNRKGNETF